MFYFVEKGGISDKSMKKIWLLLILRAIGLTLHSRYLNLMQSQNFELVFFFRQLHEKVLKVHWLTGFHFAWTNQVSSWVLYILLTSYLYLSSKTEVLMIPVARSLKGYTRYAWSISVQSFIFLIRIIIRKDWSCPFTRILGSYNNYKMKIRI